MKNNSQSNQSAQDLIKFENELLKIKLQVEFGMEQADTSELSPEIENAWLNNIYDFERQFKNAKRIKVFDALGRPEIKKLEELSSKDIPKALDDLMSLMEERGISLDCCCKYDNAVIYRFITEELFESEMDDISIKGMVHHFVYEEFHPNHDYDLRRSTELFIRNLLEKRWDPEYNSYSLSETVTVKGKAYKNAAMSEIILSFQSKRMFEIEQSEILEVTFDIEKALGRVVGSIGYFATSKRQERLIRGRYTLDFALEDTYWRINGLQFPGM